MGKGIDSEGPCWLTSFAGSRLSWCRSFQASGFSLRTRGYIANTLKLGSMIHLPHKYEYQTISPAPRPELQQDLPILPLV